MGRISDLISLIRRNTEELGKISGEMLDNYLTLNAVLHLLQVSIQAMLDIGSGIIAASGEKTPASYGDTAKILGEMKIISREEVELMRRIIGFRNIVVHGYTSISLKLVKNILDEKRYQDILNISTKLYKYALENKVDP